MPPTWFMWITHGLLFPIGYALVWLIKHVKEIHVIMKNGHDKNT